MILLLRNTVNETEKSIRVEYVSVARDVVNAKPPDGRFEPVLQWSDDDTWVLIADNTVWTEYEVTTREVLEARKKRENPVFIPVCAVCGEELLFRYASVQQKAVNMAAANRIARLGLHVINYGAIEYRFEPIDSYEDRLWCPRCKVEIFDKTGWVRKPS